MVITTTEAKASAAGPGVMASSEPACTRETRMATTKTSIIDQRPMNSVMR